jgi:two-component sensor histidine kinase
VPQAVLDAPGRNLAVTVLAALLLALSTSAFLARVYSVRLEAQIQSLHEMAIATGSDTEVERLPGTVGELEGIADAIRAADVSLKARERHKDILLAELNHRVRNTLSVLLSVVGATIRGSGQQEPLARKTAGRIMALSRAHDLLSSSEWSVIALSDLVAKTAADEQLSISYRGEAINLRPEAVAPFAQAFHELAANQRVHGTAINLPVTVTAEMVGDGSVRLAWLPAVPSDPLPWKSGFGIRLVRLCLERQLFGKIESIDAAGLVAVLPLEYVTGAGLPAEPFAARWSKTQPEASS